MSEKVQYHLYVTACSADAMQYAATQRFSRATPGYALLYQKEPLPDGIPGHEMQGVDLGRLSKVDTEWLRGCNLTIIAEEAAKKREEIGRSLESKIEMLAQELQKEKMKLEENEHGKIEPEQ